MRRSRRMILLLPTALFASAAFAQQPQITEQGIGATPPAALRTAPQPNSATTVTIPPATSVTRQSVTARTAPETPGKLSFYGERNEDGSWTIKMGAHTRTAPGFDQVYDVLHELYLESLAEKPK